MAYELNDPRYDFQIKYKMVGSDSSRTKTLGYVNYSSTGGASSAAGFDANELQALATFVCDSIISGENTGSLLQSRQDVYNDESGE
jgi:hypothetical protein